MLTKFGQFKKLKCREGSQLCHHFCVAFLKWKYLFLISLRIPHPSRSGIHWPINFSKKKIDNSVYFQQQKKCKTEEKRRVPEKLVTFFVVENIQNRDFFLVKLIGQWIPDHDGRGIARDIKKKIIFKTRQKMVTKLGQLGGTKTMALPCRQMAWKK